MKSSESWSDFHGSYHSSKYKYSSKNENLQGNSRSELLQSADGTFVKKKKGGVLSQIPQKMTNGGKRPPPKKRGIERRGSMPLLSANPSNRRGTLQRGDSVRRGMLTKSDSNRSLGGSGHRKDSQSSLKRKAMLQREDSSRSMNSNDGSKNWQAPQQESSSLNPNRRGMMPRRGAIIKSTSCRSLVGNSNEMKSSSSSNRRGMLQRGDSFRSVGSYSNRRNLPVVKPERLPLEVIKSERLLLAA